MARTFRKAAGVVALSLAVWSAAGRTLCGGEEMELTTVKSQKVHYRPREESSFTATLKNAGPAGTAVLAWQLVRDVERVEAEGEVTVDVSGSGETRAVWTVPLSREEYGAEMRVMIKDQPDSVRRDYFGISANVGTVGILGESKFANYTDLFAWAPDDFGNLSPDRDEWYSGQCGWKCSRERVRKTIADGHARGVKALTYGKGVSGGPDGIQLLLGRPDWMVLNRFGQLGGLDMSFDQWSLKHWDEPGQAWRFWNCWTPNFMIEDAVRYGAGALVKSARMFGWDGVRFDAQFDIFGGYDIAGAPMPAGPARDAVNARNVRLMKDSIRRRSRDFTFGYNYGFPMPTPTALDEAVCVGGGLVMDEGIRNASDPQHPLQDWERYARHILEESAAVRRLGGVPLIFGSGLQGAAADYGMGFCLAGGGTPYYWQFSRVPRPYDAFAVRYSGLLWNAADRFVQDPDRTIEVVADGGRKVWWKHWAKAGKAPDGTPRLLLHLFNPPLARTIRDTREMPSPLAGVHVKLSGSLGTNAPAAWLLTGDREPRVQPLRPVLRDGELVVETGPVEHWAILVIEGRGLGTWLAGLRTSDRPDEGAERVGREEGRKPLPPLALKPFAGAAEESVSGARATTLPDGRLLLENRFVRFEVDPTKGGRVASFVDRRDGMERVVAGRLEGLFFDNVYDQDGMLYQGQWGVNQAAPYVGEVLESEAGVARVRVRREAFVDEGGVPNENYKGLTIEREFRLGREAALECIVRWRNTAGEGRCPAYSMRHGYVDGAHRESLRYYRPSRRGIHRAGPDVAETDQMVWDPAAGWTATADLESGRGVAWLMDSGRVMMFYNCISAVTGRHVEEFPNTYGVDPLYMFDNASVTAIGADWYYRRAFIPAGGTWETRMTMIPLQGVRGTVAHADTLAVVTVAWPDTKASGPVRVGVLPSAESFTVDRVLLEMGGGEIALLRAADGAFEAAVPVATSAVVTVRVEGRTAAGASPAIRFPYVPVPVVGGGAPVLPAPAMAQDTRAPGDLPPRGTRTREALLLEGLGFERWGIEAALHAQGAKTRSSEFMKRRVGTAVRYFPATLAEAQRFDLIVLGAVDGFALSHEGVAILKDYVQSGGSLLVLGGLYSFGGGRFQEFGLDAWLPLRVQRTFDLVEPDGRAVWDAAGWRAAGGAGKPPNLGRLAWMHDLTPAADAAVWVRVGAHPLVAACEHGRGRIVAVAATTLGEPDGSGAFWARKLWEETRRVTLTWLTHEERALK